MAEEVTTQELPPTLKARYSKVRSTVKKSVSPYIDRKLAKGELSHIRGAAFSAAEEQQKEIDEKQKELEETEKKRKEAEELSGIDPLTGLLNRRGMDRKITDTISRIKREDEQIFRTTGEKPPERKFAVFYLDLNNLGQINKLSKDLHTAGDVVLKALAQALSIGERSVDIIARIGGDEFVIILESTDLAGALKYWERKNKQIQEMNELVNGVGSVWVSAGVAEATPDTLAEKLKVADQALSLAKQESKSRMDTRNVIKTEKDLQYQNK